MTAPNTVEPLAVTVNADGSWVSCSIGFARKDSGITRLEDAKGKVFGFGDPNSTAGYLIPAIESPAKLGAQMDTFFGKVQFTGGHEQTIVAVNRKSIDPCVTSAQSSRAQSNRFH